MKHTLSCYQFCYPFYENYCIYLFVAGRPKTTADPSIIIRQPAATMEARAVVYVTTIMAVATTISMFLVKNGHDGYLHSIYYCSIQPFSSSEPAAVAA